jgi:NADH-quinone oxidoreductase subunit M
LIREYGGIAKVMPVYAALFVVVTMSSVGVPGTNGFVGEFMVLMGTFVSPTLGGQAKLQAVLATIGVILAAVYMLSVVQRVFFGPLDNPKNKHLKDINVRETVALAPLIALIFIVGLFPNIFLSRMREGVEGVIDRYTEHRKAYQAAGDSTTATLGPRRGGPYERGYPDPVPKTDGTSPAGVQALNQVAP